jgi:hypothetical protein
MRSTSAPSRASMDARELVHQHADRAQPEREQQQQVAQQRAADGAHRVWCLVFGVWFFVIGCSLLGVRFAGWRCAGPVLRDETHSGYKPNTKHQTPNTKDNFTKHYLAAGGSSSARSM